jgi:hypothetical protein
LLRRSKHQVAVPISLVRKGGEYSAAYPEVGGSHVRALLSTFQL